MTTPETPAGPGERGNPPVDPPVDPPVQPGSGDPPPRPRPVTRVLPTQRERQCTPRVAAAIARVPVEQIEQAMNRGELRHVADRGRRRIPESALREWRGQTRGRGPAS